jgi:sec-independent protein translocase protein TatA
VIGDILQPTHLLFVLVVALLVLGPKRLPEVGRSLGKGLRDFKTAIGGEDEHDNHVEAVQNQVEAVQSHASTPPSHVTTESTPPVTAPVEHTG